MKQTIESLVEAGNANPGPPLGPALGPLGLNINEVIAKINEATADMKGMKVPVKVVVDSDTKKYDINVGTPPTIALIKKEAGVEKGTQDGSIVGNISIEQLLSVSKIKRSSLLSKNLKNAVKEIAASCKTAGITIDELEPKEFISKVDAGEYDDRLVA